MRTSNFIRFALGICMTAAVLAGCGGHSSGVVPISGVPNSVSGDQTFKYTGAKQMFQVPAGVKQIRVIALGGSGGGGMGARGGRVSAVLPVNPGELLAVYVGGGTKGQRGGFNGGAKGGYSGYNVPGIHSHGHGGGGASDVRENGDSLADRVLVVGGGGGQGGFDCGNKCQAREHGIRHQTYGLSGAGGAGGGTTGGSGEGGGGGFYGASGGGGGTQTGGGAGGKGGTGTFGYGGYGYAGRAEHGGHGGFGCDPRHQYCNEGGGGGGGGGGYYGGGGGGAAAASNDSYVGGGGGGGGGSSYVERKATSVKMWRGWRTATGNGLVVFSW